jgi:hypothetical protein
MVAAMQFFWNMIEAQQLLVVLPMFNVRLPSSAAALFRFIITIATFNFLPTDDFYNNNFNIT